MRGKTQEDFDEEEEIFDNVIDDLDLDS